MTIPERARTSTRNQTRPKRAPAAASQGAHRVLLPALVLRRDPRSVAVLQRQLGNRAVTALLAGGPVKTHIQVQRYSEDYGRKLAERRLPKARDEKLQAFLESILSGDTAPEWEQDLAGALLTDEDADTAKIIPYILEHCKDVEDNEIEAFLKQVEEAFAGPRVERNPTAELLFGQQTIDESKVNAGAEIVKTAQGYLNQLEPIAHMNVGEADKESGKIAATIAGIVDSVGQIVLDALAGDKVKAAVFNALDREGFVDRLINIQFIGQTQPTRALCHWTDTSLPLLAAVQNLGAKYTHALPSSTKSMSSVPIEVTLKEKRGMIRQANTYIKHLSELYQ